MIKYHMVRLREDAYNILLEWSKKNLGFRESLSDAVVKLVKQAN